MKTLLHGKWLIPSTEIHSDLKLYIGCQPGSQADKSDPVHICMLFLIRLSNGNHYINLSNIIFSTKLKIGVLIPKIEAFMLQQTALLSECTLNNLFELSP